MPPGPVGSSSGSSANRRALRNVDPDVTAHHDVPQLEP